MLGNFAVAVLSALRRAYLDYVAGQRSPVQSSPSGLFERRTIEPGVASSVPPSEPSAKAFQEAYRAETELAGMLEHFYAKFGGRNDPNLPPVVVWHDADNPMAQALGFPVLRQTDQSPDESEGLDV